MLAPSSGIIENVPGFGMGEGSAKDLCVRELERLRYSTLAVNLDLAAFVECSRSRTGFEHTALSLASDTSLFC